jgi:predicted transcriptional regulator
LVSAEADQSPAAGLARLRGASAALDIHRHRAYDHRHGAYDFQKGLVVIKKPVRVTDAELAVLKVLWARGPLTAKALTEAIYPDGAESEFAAVHSFLQRLERKGVVRRDRSSFVHVFSPAATQADILGQELETLFERLGGDSIAPLIMQLIQQQRLSRQEAAEIRKLLTKYTK